MRSRQQMFLTIFLVLLGFVSTDLTIAVGQEKDVAIDAMGKLQSDAMSEKKAQWGYWGIRPTSYNGWTNHSNRLIPVYTFGGSFSPYMNEGSVYRDQEKLTRLYGRLPSSTMNPNAIYADQANIYDLQKSAIENGKKYVFLIIFDGMDWQTTWAAATYKAGKVAYHEGRGTGLSFQDYTGTQTDFGFMVSSPHDGTLDGDPNTQLPTKDSDMKYGGYDSKLGGEYPWSIPSSAEYLIGRNREVPHSYTDSSSSATSMTAGIKTFNSAINVDVEGKHVDTIAHWAQRDRGMSVGAVTSVPISHATPAAAYAHNASRDDYQDLTRDLVGLPSIAHSDRPLPGLDVLIGSGWGENESRIQGQGTNAVPGNKYITDSDLKMIDVKSGGKYVTAVRTPGRKGSEVLAEAAKQSVAGGHRLLGFFGVKKGHLPFRTANGDFKPVADVKEAEVYSQDDVRENPTLADFSQTAIDVLSTNPKGFWLMIEPGDVDWANHSNNIDNSIGAVLSGEAAFDTVVHWIESRQAWKDSLVIVTADHGHFLNIIQPEVIAKSK